MKYAVIRDSKVINIILLDDITQYPTEDILVASEIANIGDSWDGISFSPAPQPKAVADWGTFNRIMILNAGYNRIAQIGNQRIVSRIEAILSPIGYANQAYFQDLIVVKTLWDTLIQEIAPTAEEVSVWNQIAIDTNMPFNFNDSGLLILEINP
ncbi:MAG: hypothetical protein ACFKPT_02540 [Gloeotrichia echinulata GP01]